MIILNLKNNVLIKIMLYIYAFYIIYSPNFFIGIGIDSIYILFFLALIQMIVYIKQKKKIKDLLSKFGIIFCLSIFLLSIYFVIVALFNGKSIIDIQGIRIVQNNMPIIYFINISFLIYYLKNLNYNSDKMINFFINVVMIQCIICLLTMIFPLFRNFSLDIYYYGRTENYWITKTRIFGLTYDYTYGTPIFHGMVSVFICILGILKNKKYFLYLPFLLLSIFMNGRTGLLIFAVSFFLCLIVYAISTKNIKKFLLYCFFALILILTGLYLIKILAPYTFNFIKVFIDDTVLFITGQGLSGNYDILFNEMLFFPKGIHLFFGHSEKVFYTSGSFYERFGNSDIGYVNDLFLGGLIFALFMYLIYYLYIYKIYKNQKNLFGRLIFVNMIVTLILANFKGEVFRSSVILSGIFFFCKMLLEKNEEDDTMKCNELKNGFNLDEKDLVSVIVPVYNVEIYLKRCVDSIINQTYSNLEIFLVDDGSTDNCGKICDEYASRDKRIKVIHKKNGGLSDARNVAIDICKGKFITFIDSDDYVSLKYIEILIYNIKKYNACISTCSYEIFSDNLIEKIQEKQNLLVLNNEDALENMLYQLNVTTSAWGKLYSKKLFKKIRYPKGKICEDLDTTYKLFSISKKIVLSDAKMYYYLQRKSSIINSNFSLKRMDAIDFASNMKEYIEINHPKIIKAAENRCFMEAMFIIGKISLKDKENVLESNKLFDVIKKYRKTVIFDKKSRKSYKIYAFLSYFGKDFLIKFFKIKNKIYEKIKL